MNHKATLSMVTTVHMYTLQSAGLLIVVSLLATMELCVLSHLMMRLWLLAPGTGS